MVYKNSGFRIRQITAKRFIVEKKVFRWYFLGLRSSWEHFISFSGLPDKPFYFMSFDSASDSLLKEIRWDVIDKFHNNNTFKND